MKNDDIEVFLQSGISESGYINSNETQMFYYRDPILAQPDVNFTFSLHVMSGAARLKAVLCPINSDDQFEDYKDNCTLSLEEMLRPDPNE